TTHLVVAKPYASHTSWSWLTSRITTLKLIKSIGNWISFINATGACRTCAIPLENLHGGVISQFTAQLQLRFEITNFAVKRVTFLIHGIYSKLIGCDIRLFLACQKRALQEQRFLQHGRQRHLRSQPLCQQMLIWLVAQRLHDSASDG